MNFLYPKIPLANLRAMFGQALIGAILAGVYGIAHDQVTYSISQEYFTRLKFLQFRYANFGFPPRIFVAEIGFLASWWVGFFCAWFIARITVPAFPRSVAFHQTLNGILIVFGFAFAGSISGYLFGVLHGSDFSAWEQLAAIHQVVDVPSFVRVAYIHDATYLGGLTGLLAAIFHVWRVKRSNQPGK